MKKRLFLCVLFVCLFLFTACGNQEQSAPTADGTMADAAAGPRYGGTLIVASKLEANNWNTNYVWDAAGPYQSFNVFSKLFNYRFATQEIYPDLALDWACTEDLTTYTIHLRDDVKWHDGEPFTSADVKWTIDDIISRGTEAQAYKVLQSVASCEAPDDYTIVLHLKEPNAIMINNLASYNGFLILPEHLYAGTDPLTNEANFKPVGTGPFEFVEYVAGSHCILKAYEDYHGVGPYLDQVIYKFIPDETTAMIALENQEVGYMTASPAFGEIERLTALDQIAVDMSSSNIVTWMGINARRDYVSHPQVRLAIATAIDREYIANVLYQGLVKPAESYYTTVIDWADNQDVRQPVYDVDEANRLLDEAGYPRGADGIRFGLTFRVFPPSIWGFQETATLIKQFLHDVGIQVNIEEYEFALRTEMTLQNQDWDLTSAGAYRGPDPSEYYAHVGTGGGSNLMQYSNPRVDELFALGLSTVDQRERATYYKEIQAILAEDIPLVNLIEYSYSRPYNTQYSGFFWQESAGNVPDHSYQGVQWQGGTRR